MKKLVYGITFLVLGGIANVSSANDLVGYWTKSQVAERINEDTRVYLEVKELIKADVENNEYIVKVTQTDLAGNILEEREDVADSFTTPEFAAKVMQTCEADGHTLKIREFGAGTIETCELRYEGFHMFTIAAVPFGVFELSMDVSWELPDGSTSFTQKTTTVVDFGKK